LGIAFFSAQIFEIGSGTSIDMVGKQGRSLARAGG